MRRTTLKDVILLCKGWYDHEAYPTIRDALGAYYRKEYYNTAEDLGEEFLFGIVLTQSMGELAAKYPDRLKGFVNGYLANGEMIFGIPDESNQAYEYQMFYRIVNFFSRLKMRGDGIAEIDTSGYFREQGKKKYLKENII